MNNKSCKQLSPLHFTSGFIGAGRQWEDSVDRQTRLWSSVVSSRVIRGNGVVQPRHDRQINVNREREHQREFSTSASLGNNFQSAKLLLCSKKKINRHYID